ncbi:MAG: rRNA pseudouridine synthase [Gammaproteobacteria bacterium]|nr:rRNA pseudouridine synthase [Gammaproteobacteria bacterium]
MRSRTKRSTEAGAGSDRVQKVLAAAGVGSRRDVERWIREGRLRVNGEVPALGLKIARGDKVTLDGRPVRWRAPAGRAAQVIVYHRSPGDPLDLKEAGSRAALHLRLPRSAGRWLAVQSLPPVDGGLEILTDDGAWAQRISRGVHGLEVGYLLRMRGPLDDGLVEEFRASTMHENEPLAILAAVPQYGEGANHWLDVTARATRAALVRHWWAARGFIVSRLIRVRFGPVRLGRDLPRGRSRPMSTEERAELEAQADAARAAPADPAAREGAEARAIEPRNSRPTRLANPD